MIKTARPALQQQTAKAEDVLSDKVLSLIVWRGKGDLPGMIFTHVANFKAAGERLLLLRLSYYQDKFARVYQCGSETLFSMGSIHHHDDLSIHSFFLCFNSLLYI